MGYISGRWCRGWHLAAGARLDYILLVGTGGACFPGVFCFFNEDTCVTHCSGVGVLHFCGALSETIWITHHMAHQSGLVWIIIIVVDLDLSILPDAFGLRAFDVSKPLTCICCQILLLMNSAS